MNAIFTSWGEHKHSIRQVPLQLLGIELFDQIACSWLFEELQGCRQLQQMLFLQQETAWEMLTRVLQYPESQASNRYSLLEIITQQVNWLRKGTCSCLIPCLHLMWNPPATDTSLLRQQLTTVGNFPKKVLWMNLVMWWLRTWGLKCWRGCEKREPPYIVGRNVKLVLPL